MGQSTQAEPKHRQKSLARSAVAPWRTESGIPQADIAQQPNCHRNILQDRDLGVAVLKKLQHILIHLGDGQPYGASVRAQPILTTSLHRDPKKSTTRHSSSARGIQSARA